MEPLLLRDRNCADRVVASLLRGEYSPPGTVVLISNKAYHWSTLYPFSLGFRPREGGSTLSWESIARASRRAPSISFSLNPYRTKRRLERSVFWNIYLRCRDSLDGLERRLRQLIVRVRDDAPLPLSVTRYVPRARARRFESRPTTDKS